MESLNQVHFLYQYSLKMFLDIFSSVLVSSGLNAVTDYTARLSIITEELFTVSTLQLAYWKQMVQNLLGLILIELRFFVKIFGKTITFDFKDST